MAIRNLHSFWQHLEQNAQSSAAHHIWMLVGYPSSSHAGGTQNSSPLMCKNESNTQTSSFFLSQNTRFHAGRRNQHVKQTKFPYPSSSPSPSTRKTGNRIANHENRCKQNQEIKNNSSSLKWKGTTQMAKSNHPLDK